MLNGAFWKLQLDMRPNIWRWVVQLKTRKNWIRLASISPPPRSYRSSSFYSSMAVTLQQSDVIRTTSYRGVYSCKRLDTRLDIQACFRRLLLIGTWYIICHVFSECWLQVCFKWTDKWNRNMKFTVRAFWLADECRPSDLIGCYFRALMVYHICKHGGVFFLQESRWC